MLDLGCGTEQCYGHEGRLVPGCPECRYRLRQERDCTKSLRKLIDLGCFEALRKGISFRQWIANTIDPQRDEEGENGE